MAPFHFHVTQVKSNAGQSAIASAVYQSGEKIYSEYYEEVSDFYPQGRRDLFGDSSAIARSTRIRKPSNALERRRAGQARQESSASIQLYPLYRKGASTFEIIHLNKVVRTLHRESCIHQIDSVIQISPTKGMIGMDEFIQCL